MITAQEFLELMNDNEMVFLSQENCTTCKAIEAAAEQNSFNMPEIFKFDIRSKDPKMKEAAEKIASLNIMSTPALIKGDEVRFPHDYEELLNYIEELEAC